MKVIDFFCGMGGASLGYKKSGNSVILAIDKWSDALQTHSYNLPEVPTINCDISKLDIKNLPYADIYHLSPPCQSFSTSGKQRGFNSDNGNLFLVAVNILKDKRPNIFIIENVKGLSNHLKKECKDIFSDFEEYSITQNVINAKDCGVCQSRERLFIVGIKKNFGKFNIPKKINNNQSFENVISAVKDCNYGFPKHTENLIQKIKFIPQGGNVMDIPENIRPKSFKNSYSRLRADKIPPTITRNYNCPSSANCIHPYENRGLSEAEALFIQGFPKEWKVKGKQKNLQIGNAVPPQMIEHIMTGIVIY